MHDQDTEQTLKTIPLFSELTDEQLIEISKNTVHKTYSKNEIIFLEDDYYRGFYVILKGSVKIYKLTSGGKESVVHIAKPHTIFADIPLFDGINYPVNAKTLEACSMVFFPKQVFIDFIKNNPEVSLKMLAAYAKRLKALMAQIEDLSTKEVSSRFIKYIIREIKKSGTASLPEPFIKLKVPKSTIASYIGTTIETLSRTLNKLQKDNIIRLQDKRIIVIDPEALEKLALE